MAMDDDLSDFGRWLAQLADPKHSVKLRELAALSHLDGERLDAFTGRWRQVDSERRRWVVHQLMEMAEDDVTLDFDSVLLACLSDDDAQVRAVAIQGLWEYQ